MSKSNLSDKHNKLIVFQGKEVRRAWNSDEWYYSLVDIVGVLTNSTNPTDYLKKIRKRDSELGSYIGTNCPQVEMETSTEISKEEEPDTFDENKNVAKRGGKVAGNARKDAEKELGRSVISKQSILKEI